MGTNYAHNPLLVCQAVEPAYACRRTQSQHLMPQFSFEKSFFGHCCCSEPLPGFPHTASLRQVQSLSGSWPVTAYLFLSSSCRHDPPHSLAPSWPVTTAWLGYTASGVCACMLPPFLPHPRLPIQVSCGRELRLAGTDLLSSEEVVPAAAVVPAQGPRTFSIRLETLLSAGI